MSLEILLHIEGEQPYLCEIDEIPHGSAPVIVVHSPRRRDGTPVSYLSEGVNTVIFPWHRINFIQVLPSAQEEDVIGFVRE